MGSVSVSLFGNRLSLCSSDLPQTVNPTSASQGLALTGVCCMPVLKWCSNHTYTSIQYAGYEFAAPCPTEAEGGYSEAVLEELSDG